MEPCAVCDGVIKSSRIRAKGKLFHEECFVCYNCKTSLESFFFKDGKLYCDPCEVAIYAKKCDHCQLPIQSTIVNARNKIFHPECFICSQCTSIIKGGFFYIEGSFVCDSCDSTKKPSLNTGGRSSGTLPTPTPNNISINVSASTPPTTPPLSRHNTPPSPSFVNSNNNIQTNNQPAPLVHTVSAIDVTGRNANAPIEVPGTNIVLSQLPPNTTIYVVNNNSSNSIPNLSQLSLNNNGDSNGNNVGSANNSPNIPRRSSQTITVQQLQPNGIGSSSDSIVMTPTASPKLSGTLTVPSSSSSSSLTSSTGVPLPPIEKFVPLINGKTLPELLKHQSFEDILANVMRSKIKVHNEIKKSDVTFGDVIASGASGKVFKGVYKGRDVAIKVYSADNICFSREEFDREVSIMSLVDHECFTEFYGANTEKNDYLFHVSELVKGGCLRDILLNKDVSLTYAQQVSIALDVATGMEYLHSFGVIHRDLKSGNVLITDDLRGKVIDFGTSRAIDLSKQMTLNLGTSCWMAPEVFRNEPYTELCDVYSFGIVLWEIFCRRDPYDGVNSWSIPVMVTKGERPTIPAECPSEYAKLIKACWVDKAKKRPKFKEIRTTLNKIYGGLTVKSKRSSTSLFGKKKD